MPGDVILNIQGNHMPIYVQPSESVENVCAHERVNVLNFEGPFRRSINSPAGKIANNFLLVSWTVWIITECHWQHTQANNQDVA